MISSNQQPPERFGPFLLLSPLGVGGMGAAYLSMHVDSGSLLVVKRMHPEFLRDEVIFKRFVHEAEVAAHVRHPNVAALVAMGTVDQEPFLATEYVFGIQVSQIVERIETAQIEPIPLKIGLALAVDLASGVDAIHGAKHQETGQPLGLIHRDIGSRNVLVGFDGQIRIIDLGLGKSILADWQTASQVLAGSPDYMAPEQALGSRVDGRADVYSASVTAWEIIAGRKRIREEGVAARLARAVEAQPEPLCLYRADAPRRLEAILKQAMHPDPEQRTPTSHVFRKVLIEELEALGRPVSKEEIVAWLEAACATVIAREKRVLAELTARARNQGGSSIARTEMLVRRDDVLATPAPYRFYATGAEDQVPRPSARAEPRVYPRWLRALLMITAGLVLLTIAGLTALLLRAPARDDVQVTGLPEREGDRRDGAPSVGKATTAHPGGAAAEMPPRAEGSTGGAHVRSEDEGDDPAGGGTTLEPNEPALPALTPETARRKAELVHRIRQLRRVRFEVAFQRRLTELSTKLSRARSAKALDEVEGALLRLEAQRVR